MEEKRLADEKTLMEGKIVTNYEIDTQLCQLPYSPILIIVPASVVDNWARELHTWGHFSVQVFGSDSDRANSLHRVKIGMDDIMLCGKELFSKNIDEFLKIKKWKLVVVDEFHNYKNKASQAYKKLLELRNDSCCPIIGLTGTVMPNEYKVRPCMY